MTSLNGSQRNSSPIHANQIAWAHICLKRAGLLASGRRGIYQIAPHSEEVLSSPPAQINMHFLERYREYRELRAKQSSEDTPRRNESVAEDNEPTTRLTPDEQIRNGFQLYQSNLAAQLLDRVRQASPVFFERLVVELLVAMGYGGSYADAAEVVGKSGDGGIDGIIKEDRLGLESIYIQAKRWEATVGRPEVQQFAGALHGNRARKGVMITTSGFSRDAIEYAKASPIATVLISGKQLAGLMVEFGVGVSGVGAFKLKKLDEDYFAELDL